MLSPPTHQSGPARRPPSGLPAAVQVHATVTRTAGDADEFEACAQNSTVTGSSSVVPSPPTHQPSTPQTHHIDDTRTGHSVVVEELGDARTQNSSFNPRDVVKNDAVWSTVEALQLMDDTSASQHNFLDILQFGKNLYKRGLEASYTHSMSEVTLDDVDLMWPKTWQGAMKLLTDEGYQATKIPRYKEIFER